MEKRTRSSFIGLLCMGLALAAGAAAAASVRQTPAVPADAIAGKWFGTTTFEGDRIEIGFELGRNAEQHIEIRLYQPILNVYGMLLPGFLEQQGERWVAKEVSLSVKLTGDRLTGTFMGPAAPIELARVDRLPSDPPVPDLPAGPGPRWSTKLGAPIFASAALRDGVAYVGTTGGVFQAVSAKDGSFVWTFSAGRPMFGEALTTAEHVYFVCDNGFLFKLLRRSGEELWRYDLGDAQVSRILPHPGVYDFDYLGPRPLLVDGVLYVGAGDGGCHAIDDANGERIWRIVPGGKLRTSAVLAGERVIFGCDDGNVYAVERDTGQQAWKKDTRGPVTGTPALVDGKLVVGTRGSVLAALKPDNGELAWRTPFWGSWVESEAVLPGGVLYIGSSDLRRVSAIDPANGRVRWRTDVFGWSWGRPASSSDTLYIGVAGARPYVIRHVGSLTALDLASGVIRWRWPMPEWPGSFLNGFVGSPAIEGDVLVIGGLDGTLYAFPVE